MCTDQARPLGRAALMLVLLTAATRAGAAAPTPSSEPVLPYAHNEQGNLNVCSAESPVSDDPAARCQSDFDASGSVSSCDVSAFVRAWIVDVSAGTTAADFNADGAVSSADLSVFLSVWISETAGGC